MAATEPIVAISPWAVLWTAPAILIASMMIAWGAEAAQLFMAQGFALIILAWMQTLPEFAVEALLAWHRETPLLIANLTGAIRLLTGLGWPMIYFTAAVAYRKLHGKPLDEVQIAPRQSVQVVGVLICLVYVAVIAAKGSLTVWDAAILIAIYITYLWLLRHMPAEEGESVEDLGRVPRAIVEARPRWRNVSIFALFAMGGLMVFSVADPFLGSLFALSSVAGISQFVFIQWVAPFVSEFPEFVSAFYWSRSIDRASLALMNMVSSNITQWAVLAALLPVVLSASVGHPTPIVFDSEQRIEILMTLGQSLVGMLFLLNMQLAWWEALVLFVLWVVQFGFSLVHPSLSGWGYLAGHIRVWTTIAYFAWAALESIRLLLGHRRPEAFGCFVSVWQEHVR